MKLYHRERFLGEISHASPEGVWMSGEITLSSDSADYRSFFEFMTDESKAMEDIPFSEELLDPENWFIEENSQRRGIDIPAVHADGAIEWRWR